MAVILVQVGLFFCFRPSPSVAYVHLWHGIEPSKVRRRIGSCTDVQAPSLIDLIVVEREADTVRPTVTTVWYAMVHNFIISVKAMTVDFFAMRAADTH
jgi:hypothetical protein